jgi:hypothetical protein
MLKEDVEARRAIEGLRKRVLSAGLVLRRVSRDRYVLCRRHGGRALAMYRADVCVLYTRPAFAPEARSLAQGLAVALIW